MQYLLLARHGNTFAPGEKPVWVGARNDLPLVEKGIEQATAFAHSMLDNNLAPSIIYCASLKRTLFYAQSIKENLNTNVPLVIDNRLIEIDYGSWSGLSNDEISNKFGNHELNLWLDKGGWPRSFLNSEQEVVTEVLSFAEDITKPAADKKIVLVITSNGRLKYFLKLVPNLWDQYTNCTKWKIATGNVALLAYEKSSWNLIFWNETPQLTCSFLKTQTTVWAGKA